MSLVNSRQDHSMFLATESNHELGGMILHEAPVRELLETEVGQVKLADSKVSKEDAGSSSGSGVGKGRKKVVIPWTDEEHLKFLKGVDKYGKGAWAMISSQAVVTKTPKQVTSHAQKYYLRQDNNNKKKKRRSIHDVTIKDVQEPTTSSPSPSYGTHSVTPTPSIQDIASTTINVQVEPPPLATAGFNDIVKGKGVLIEPSSTPYLCDGQYYYGGQGEGPQPLPMNYCQVAGEASQPLFNLYDSQGEPLPMNYCQVGESSQPLFNLYDSQGDGAPMSYCQVGEASQPLFNLYDSQGGGEVQPPLAASLYDIGKGKGVLAESASYLCDGHYYYGGQVEGPQPLPMNYFSSGQVGAASQPSFNFYDNQGGGTQPLPMNYFSGSQVGETSQPLFNLYDTQGEGPQPLPMNYCQAPQPVFNLYDTQGEGGEVQPPLATSLYDIGKLGEGEPAEITSSAPYLYDGQCFGGQGEGPQPLPMNYCQAPQPVFNLYDTQGGGTFCDYDAGALVWNEYSSYDNNSYYYYLSDYY